MKLSIFKDINVIDTFAIIVILLVAFFFQFAYHELPCPLCLLQRVGLLLISIGFVMNLRFGFKARHYAFSLLAAVYTAAVSMRQILLHIEPASGAYGDPFLGLHLYTWVFIVSIIYIVWTAFVLMFSNQFKLSYKEPTSKSLKILITAVFVLLIILCFANAATAFFECGLHQCPDNP